MLRSLLPAVALLALVARPAEACWVDNSTWQSRVAEADLIGILECTVGGVDVARFRVVESWGGTHKPGAELTIGCSGTYLPGQRILIVSAPPTQLRRFPSRAVCFNSSISTSGRRLPLGGRRLAVDRAFTFRGLVRLPLRGAASHSLREVNADHRTLAAYKQAALALLALPAPERELRVLRSLVKRHARRLGRPAVAQAEAAGSARALVEALIGYPKAGLVLAIGGGQAAAEVLTEVTRDAQAPERAARLKTLQAIRARLKPSAPRPRGAIGWPARAWMLSRIEQHLDQYAAPRSPQLKAPLGELIKRLAAWQADGSADPYWLASTLCLGLNTDRVAHLKTLLKATEPWLRVAAAVYLTFEAAPARRLGRRALRKLSELPGGAGAWAALARARRGEAAALPRLLKVFRDEADTSAGLARLQSRTRVLLSNAAQRAKLDAPPLPTTPSPEAYAKLRGWYLAHADRLAPRDPWLKELSAQKID